MIMPRWFWFLTGLIPYLLMFGAVSIQLVWEDEETGEVETITFNGWLFGMGDE